MASFAATISWLKGSLLPPTAPPQRLVFDCDKVERGRRAFLAERRDGGDRIAYETHLLERQRMFVLAHREDAEGPRQVTAREHRLDSGQGPRPRRLDAHDACVRV